MQTNNRSTVSPLQLLIDLKIRYTTSTIPGLEALSCESGFDFGDHIHNGHVLWVNSSGGERFQLKGHSDILQPGSVSIIEPGVVHSNRPLSDEGRHLRSLYLEEDFFRYLDQLCTGYGGRVPELPSMVIKRPDYWQQTIALHQAIIIGEEEIRIEELIIQLFSGLAKDTFGESLDISGLRNGHQTLNRVVDYMHDRIGRDISLEDLAEVAGCTSFHLMRLFRKFLGMSPHAYLIQLRLERARELLNQGESIADAAYLSGFSDQSHLTRRFKQRYGLPPGAYLTQKNK